MSSEAGGVYHLRLLSVTARLVLPTRGPLRFLGLRGVSGKPKRKSMSERGISIYTHYQDPIRVESGTLCLK